MNQYQRIGEMLYSQGLLTQAQLAKALEAQAQSRRRFGEVLVALGYVDESAITKCLAQQYDLPLAKLSSLRPDKEVLALVTPTFALSRLFLPVAMTDNELHGVIADPADIEATDMLTQALRRRLVLSIAPQSRLFDFIAKCYSLQSSSRAIANPPAPKPARRKKKIVPQADRNQLLDALANIADSVPLAA